MLRGHDAAAPAGVRGAPWPSCRPGRCINVRARGRRRDDELQWEPRRWARVHAAALQPALLTMEGLEDDSWAAEMASFLGDLDAAGGVAAPDAVAVAAAAAMEQERAQPRDVAGSALAAAMLAPEDSPLLQELSEAASGLEAGYYRQVHPAQSIRTADAQRVRFRADPWLCAEAGLPSPLCAADLIACFGTWDSRPMPRLAMSYAGYQFGVLNKGLGDGRAFVWGQWRRRSRVAAEATAASGGDSHRSELWEIGTKGSGKTPFSRGHDGLLTLEGAVRETVGAEALGAAGIRTSRVITIIETEGTAAVLRGVPAVGCAGAVLVRFARSFVRFGSFERLLHLDLTRAEQQAQIRTLASYCLRHCHPELMDGASKASQGNDRGEDGSMFRALFVAVRVCMLSSQPCAAVALIAKH